MQRVHRHPVRSGPFTMIALVIIGWATARSLWVASSWVVGAPAPYIPALPPNIDPLPLQAMATNASAPHQSTPMMEMEPRVPVAAATMPVPVMPLRFAATSAPTTSPGGFIAMQRALLRSGPLGSNRRFIMAAAPAALQSPLAFSGARADSGRQRWSVSAWAFYRPQAPVQPGSGLYGGSQAGLRAAYALGDGWQAYGRLSATPVNRDSAEGAVGLALRPLSRVPLTLAIERRVRIAGDGRNAFAAYVTGGVSDRPAPAQFRIDAYGAAGIVGASRHDIFAEGSLTARRRVADLGPVHFSAGAGIWGGAQTGISRLDVGPSVALRWEGAPLTLSLDWRQRMAGNSAPASGPAITLSADF